jgi:hypothetical protein
VRRGVDHQFLGHVAAPSKSTIEKFDAKRGDAEKKQCFLSKNTLAADQGGLNRISQNHKSFIYREMQDEQDENRKLAA